MIMRILSKNVDAIFLQKCTSYIGRILMEISNTIIRMMERMSNPCFLVKDETILYVNNPAASMQIQPNMPLKKLLAADCSYATRPIYRHS